MAQNKSTPEDDIALYKPESVVGHLAQQKNLRQLAAMGKMPHGILLHGPKGVGKRLFAENLGWGLICGFDSTEADVLRYNTTSPHMPVLTHGAYAGFGVLEKDGAFIKVAQVRELTNKLALADEGWRIIIVDAADDLNIAAANALLKTLEEPQGQTLLVLISHAPSKLLPTIVSRCQQIRLSALDTDDLNTVLERKKAKTSAALLKLADGAPGRALALATQGESILTSIEAFFEEVERKQTFNFAQTAEQLLGQANNPALVFDLILWHTAQKARAQTQTQNNQQAFVWGQVYQNVQQVVANQQEYNLTPQLALEKVLTTLHNETI